MQHQVGVPPRRITEICNGVDTDRFHPAPGGRARIAGCPFTDPSLWLAGTVGRMQTVKAQTLLARAFIRALQLEPALRERLRLVMVGDGPLRAEAQALLDAAGVGHLAWLPGERSDVPDVMRGLDGFVLPSLAEGISNTILEAMASGLPVIATRGGRQCGTGAARRDRRDRAACRCRGAGRKPGAPGHRSGARRGDGPGRPGRRRAAFQPAGDGGGLQGLYDRLLARRW